MLTQNDELTLNERGITFKNAEQQLNSFKTGFPFLEIISVAETGKGIIQVSAEEETTLLKRWDNYLNTSASILKFVPASGAASRMFKDLFEYINKPTADCLTDFEQTFFDQIENFAFYNDLDKKCIENEGENISSLKQSKKYNAIVTNLLLEKGLNYGALPKGLLKFHRYLTENRTPMQEHLVEGAMYAANGKREVNIHFTVSKEHRDLFQNHLDACKTDYENTLQVKINVGFSEQKPSTDTLAADQNNEPFRDNGKLVFRPGGHGALIENLNDLNYDIIFIKNIDNVVPDSLKPTTVRFKKIIAGKLIELQQKSFEYLKLLEDHMISDAKLLEISHFCENELNNHFSTILSFSTEALRQFLIQKLNRPIRVCGMVKNVGEPGGGPFLVKNNDGTLSLQILESSQINLNNPDDQLKMKQSTHFNPVDLVCGVKNYKGEKFDLLQFVDKNTGFISIKSKNGKTLKALELPGLWNGAMSDWNTIFVEVPILTFNPVKTINDLLRTEHQ